MDVSIDTDITIHLYKAGKETLLFAYFDTIYVHEFVLEREIKKKSQFVYQKVRDEIERGNIILVGQKYLIELGVKRIFEDRLFDMATLLDYGEANAIALAATLGIASLVTDDTKDAGPHDILVKEYYEDIIPFAFYELLFLDYIRSNDDFAKFKSDYDLINITAYPDHPMDFQSRIKRVVRRFSKHGTERDIEWINSFCREQHIDYRARMRLLRAHLMEIEN